MIKISSVSKTYETGNRAIKGAPLTINDGEFVFIVGRNGPGKSTLMRPLPKELEPTKGRIMVNDMDLGRMPGGYIPKYCRRLGMVSQDFRLLKNRTVSENVILAQRVIGMPAKAIRETVPEMLRLVGLSSRHKVYSRQLSRGEQQRVAIARVSINDPETFLTGEPTGNLDSFNTHEIMRLLEEIDQGGTTVTVVMHSQEIVDKTNKRIITMERGSVISDVGGYH